MNEKEYDLLMKDLCGRLPYGVKANVSAWDEEKQEEGNKTYGRIMSRSGRHAYEDATEAALQYCLTNLI